MLGRARIRGEGDEPGRRFARWPAIAFERITDSGDLYVQRLMSGAIRRLTYDRRYVHGIAWIDNKEMLFSSTVRGVGLYGELPHCHRRALETATCGRSEGDAYAPAIVRPPKGAASPGLSSSRATDKLTHVGTVSKPLASGSGAFTSTRDGRWIAWAQAGREESDLMLLENFR